MGTVHRLVRDTGESSQTGRYRWREQFNGFSVHDTQTGKCAGMGDGTDLFCESPEEGGDCLQPGTQRFYDALNAYFEQNQAEIGEAYFKEAVA